MFLIARSIFPGSEGLIIIKMTCTKRSNETFRQCYAASRLSTFSYYPRLYRCRCTRSHSYCVSR